MLPFSFCAIAVFVLQPHYFEDAPRLLALLFVLLGPVSLFSTSLGTLMFQFDSAWICRSQCNLPRGCYDICLTGHWRLDSQEALHPSQDVLVDATMPFVNYFKLCNLSG
jgi:hypothetical protein